MRDYTQWHPAFCAAIKLELRENREELRYIIEYNINVKPIQIDLLVILGEDNADAVLQVSARVNKQVFDRVKEDGEMCEAMLELMRPELDSAYEKGISQGLDLGKFEMAMQMMLAGDITRSRACAILGMTEQEFAAKESAYTRE